MDEDLIKWAEKIKEHFQYVDATTQVVLKGHLLSEQSLDTILGRFVFHPEHLQSAELEFAQKVNLARSISLDEHNNEMWKLVNAINSLRNELAHSLKSEKRQRKTQRVIELYFKLLGNEQMAARNKNDPEEAVLAYAAALFLSFLAGLEAEVDRFCGYVNVLDVAINPHRHASNLTSKNGS